MFCIFVSVKENWKHLEFLVCDPLSLWCGQQWNSLVKNGTILFTDETPFVHFREEQKPDILDQIEELKATILEKLDTMNELKTKLRMAYVPSTVCSHLEQCIKETEVISYKPD